LQKSKGSKSWIAKKVADGQSSLTLKGFAENFLKLSSIICKKYFRKKLQETPHLGDVS
jgi:hypothetical protein